MKIQRKYVALNYSKLLKVKYIYVRLRKQYFHDEGLFKGYSHKRKRIMSYIKWVL